MSRRIAGIGFIFACTSVAWFILAGSIQSRTYVLNDKLKPDVASIWGAPQEQRTPEAELGNAALYPDRSRIEVSLWLDHRQKGLLWYSTYTVQFAGTYTYRNPGSDQEMVTVRLPFPAAQGILDGLAMEVNGRPLPFRSDTRKASVSFPLAVGEAAELRVRYRSQGLESWHYGLSGGTQTRDFALVLKTNFKQIDFPANTLSPTGKQPIAGGWDLTWRYQNLISGFRIGIALPEKLQPGPLASQISLFAPVSLLLFFFVIFILTTLRNIDLHPMNYFFLAASFFSFHLLLAYLADHIPIHLAFAICSAASVFLVVSYLRIVIGARFAVVEAGTAQVTYLVLFSYAFFFKGFSGLAVTIGCIVTLFVAMQLTAHIDWDARFTR